MPKPRGEHRHHKGEAKDSTTAQLAPPNREGAHAETRQPTPVEKKTHPELTLSDLFVSRQFRKDFLGDTPQAF